MRLRWVVDAFTELSTCRPAGMGGVRPIPWTAIDQYVKARQVPDPHRFETLIRVMDSAVLDSRRREDR